MATIAAIVPNYNDSRFLINILSKLSRQRFDEIIVVDDRSTDNSMELLETLKEKFKFTIMSGSRRGNAFLTGCKFTKCEYVAGWSCDDEPREGYLTQMRHAIRDYPLVDLYMANAEVHKEGNVYHRVLLPFDAYISPQYARKLFKNGHARAINYIGALYKKETILTCPVQKANFDEVYTHKSMLEKGFINLGEELVLYRSYTEGFGNAQSMIETVLHAQDKKHAIISRLALKIVKRLPKFLRRRFYKWYYAYDPRREKL